MNMRKNKNLKEATINKNYTSQFRLQTWVYHLTLCCFYDLEYLFSDNQKPEA